MPGSLSSKPVADEVLGVLSSRYTVDLCGGAVRLVTDDLPGTAVCAIVRTEERLLLVVDLEKPLAHRHARQMIRETIAACKGAEAVEALLSEILARVNCSLRLVS